ncbi:MAG: GntP family permease [Bacteroidales bacterium]|jgi:GntP family gluconate:H+ symporter|nr:GntP family permease [Bacteroidales bacterium]
MLIVILLILSVLFIIVSTVKYKLHPFLALLFTAIAYGIFSGMPLDKLVESVSSGFGNTIGYIGIVIVAGCIIGNFLEQSGGAYTLAEVVLKIVGKKRVHLVMIIIGYIVSIPVFADSGFVILSSLNRALSKRAKISLAGSAIALVLGLIITHCLVPPTPGPIAAAGILNADLGLVILFGLLVGLAPLVTGWLFASKFASRTYIDPNPDLTEEQLTAKMKEAPGAFKAFMPILVPIFLIVIKSISEFPSNPLGTGVIKSVSGFIGAPLVALLIGTLLSFLLPKKFDRAMLSGAGWVGKALLDASIIILITGAGGAFGMVLRNSGIADVIGNSLAEINLSIWLPFILAAALKSAQGSSTVAIITTASLMAPLMSSLGFDTPVDKALVVLSIGAGSMVVSHANDSIFWVVTQMSGMDVRTGYKLHTLGTLVIGITSMMAIWLLFVMNM